MFTRQAPITEQSAVTLAAAIRAGVLSAREVIDAHIEVLERVNRAVNAVVVARYDAARLEADRADALIAGASAAELPPLLGVPLTVKESVAVAGLPNTAGVVARRGITATHNATVVQRLVDAGAIILGLTNTSEACMWTETRNRVYGRTNNAYDQRRSAGGSSGGEGAAIGSGATPIGLGTDTLGSIRIPALCNGVFGHRPSTGLVPLTGSWPPPYGVAKMCVNGPLARRAEDLMPVLRIMAGPDGVDPLVHPMELPDPDRALLRGVRVTLIEEAFLPGAARQMLRARDRAAAALETAGARIEYRSLKSLRSIGFLTTVVLAEETGRRFADVMNEQGARPLALRELCAPRGNHTAPMRALVIGEKFESLLPKRLVRQLVQNAHAIENAMGEAIGDGLVLHPTTASVAPRHGTTTGQPWHANGVAAFSLAGLPVTQVPLGFAPNGLPLGVQVAGRLGHDHLTIAAAVELERAFGGWIPPHRTRANAIEARTAEVRN
ncbi:fatty acid amide hydrolase 2 [Mycobacterium sp. MAA66]|uniref:amidase n=1 Tax=Mycobacterium sp. MAA66 TaxID=3156297 RepID=UPI003514EF8A